MILLIRIFPAVIEVGVYFWRLDETFYNVLRNLPPRFNITADDKQGIRGLSFVGLLNGLSYSMITTSATLLGTNLYQGIILLIFGFISFMVCELNILKLHGFRNLDRAETITLVLSILVFVTFLALYDQVLAISFPVG